MKQAKGTRNWKITHAREDAHRNITVLMISVFSLCAYYKSKISNIRTQGIPRFSIQLIGDLYSSIKVDFSGGRRRRASSACVYYISSPNRGYVFYNPYSRFTGVSGKC